MEFQEGKNIQWRRKMRLLAAAAAVSLQGCRGFSTTATGSSLASCSSSSTSCSSGCGPLHAKFQTNDQEFAWKYTMSSSNVPKHSHRWTNSENRYSGSSSFLWGSNSTATSSSAMTAGVGMLGFDVSLPFLPTRQQVNGLSLLELQMACRDRNVPFALESTEEDLKHQLLQWTSQQHKQRVHQRRQTQPQQQQQQEDLISEKKIPAKKQRPKKQTLPSVLPIDLESMDATVIKPLIHRRQALMASKTTPNKKKIDISTRPTKSTKEYRLDLSKAFEAPPSLYSNYQVQQIYKQAKYADQNGQTQKALSLLHLLKTATPHDMRVPRRIARLYLAQGQVAQARSILQEALKQSPQNPHLLHGLASLYYKYYLSYTMAKQLYQKAIRADPYMPNAHHALGTLEHSKGNIKAATEVLRNGIQYCPDNHRLHHAMGDLYRDANMHTHAIQSYNRALDICNVQKKEYAKSFLHTALSYVMYDLGQIQEAKMHLQSSIDNNPLHAQGWLAYAHLEQTEGNISRSRDIYQQAANALEQHQKHRQNQSSYSHQWLHLYLSWAAMEEQYGDYHLSNNVFSRAVSHAFAKNNPTNKFQLILSWANFQWRHGYYDRAKTLFQIASKDSSMDENDIPQRALPIRLQGQLEMTSLKDYKAARNILYEGARKLCESTSSSILISADTNEAIELSKLYHLWALCEWHLDQFQRTEALLEHAMRLVPADDEHPANKEMRVALLYTNARFLFEAMNEPILAQHCICLALSQDVNLPHLWSLWGRVAKSIGDEKLTAQCHEQRNKLLRKNNSSKGGDALSDLAVLLNVSSPDSDLTFDLDDMLRKAPWHNKLKQEKRSNRRRNRPTESAAEWLDQLIFPKPPKLTIQRKRKTSQKKMLQSQHD